MRTRRSRSLPRSRRIGSTSNIRTRLFSDVLRNNGNRFTLSNFPRRTVSTPTSEGRKPIIEREEPVPPVKPDLTVENVDLNISTNSKEHHTNEYSISEEGRGLIVRRGQTFDIAVEVNRDYDVKKDDIKLVFLAGDNPSPTKGTRVSLILSDKDTKKEWGAWILKNEKKRLSIRINTPPTCFVGIWKLQIETIVKSDNKTIVFDMCHDQNIYLLFNPWCKDDQVYLHEQDLLNEYILNDKGRIYVGNQKSMNGRKWNFGQFEKDILDCAMYLLDSNVSLWSTRGDPVKMARKISALANGSDEYGVLEGNWSGDYDGGKSPLHWVGSIAILQEYYKTKETVCYGQCWVFSGITTTLCRTLGIPARSVTNFASAHDCDGSISIDNHFDSTGDSLEELNDDSVWNFHVWNDVWMARPDLPKGYGGWQAIDATPQEASNGIYQCGPAPLAAIKTGEVYLPFDTPFVFAEVNADKVFWQMTETGDLKNIGLQKHSIGKHISTHLPTGKPLGNWETFCYDRYREDVTNQYKHQEGSNEERAAVMRANQESTKKGIYHEGKAMDVQFELLEKEAAPYGKDFEIILKISNNSNEIRTLSGCICTSTMYYTGVPAKRVKNLAIENEKIAANKSKELILKVTFDEYYSKLVDQCHMKMSCMCTILETKHTYVDQDTFRLIKPELKIKAPTTGKVGEKMKAEVSFTNPLPCALTSSELTVEGTGLTKNQVLLQSIVPSNQTFMTTVEIIPTKAGLRELIVSFNSKELEMVDGSCEIKISE
ncbi:hemocyte protein-glutamine gamma-glutamyltransferase-like [Mytilus galloprovincialis]|uniref:hemocyte protein-glutamine gamma-glutamyltransferase-like n=1 Tax=Mytilus galloprovincialis TaxID=29158 RepID=UPI003F7B9052